jgi:protein O-GlcNAc transferase
LSLPPKLTDLEPDFTLYGIPQTLYKLHTDLDHILIDILSTDLKGFIVMPKGQESKWSSLVRDRLMGGGGGGGQTSETNDFLKRLLFVRQMSEREYLTFCSVVDVIIDPYPVGGGRSSFEILSTGMYIYIHMYIWIYMY